MSDKKIEWALEMEDVIVSACLKNGARILRAENTWDPDYFKDRTADRSGKSRDAS